ncbi:hypothetical protein H8E88_33665 [candidate division KSB1 bacterium]|nr:hypothetical protein [candidate division KSB1 bacterium]
MTLKENKALVNRIIEEVSNKRNLALIDELFSTNISIIVSPQVYRTTGRDTNK